MPSVLNSGTPNFIQIPISPELGVPYSLLCSQHLVECTLWFVSVLVGVSGMCGVCIYVHVCVHVHVKVNTHG